MVFLYPAPCVARSKECRFLRPACGLSLRSRAKLVGFDANKVGIKPGNLATVKGSSGWRLFVASYY